MEFAMTSFPWPSRQCINRNLKFFGLLPSSSDLKISLKCLWVTAKKFNLKLILENKIQGLGFIFSDTSTLCKINHQTSMLLKGPGPTPYRFILFPIWGALYIQVLFTESKIFSLTYLKNQSIKLWKSTYFDLFVVEAKTQSLWEWLQRNTDQKNHSHGFILIALL